MIAAAKRAWRPGTPVAYGHARSQLRTPHYRRTSGPAVAPDGAKGSRTPDLLNAIKQFSIILIVPRCALASLPDRYITDFPCFIYEPSSRFGLWASTSVPVYRNPGEAPLKPAGDEDAGSNDRNGH